MIRRIVLTLLVLMAVQLPALAQKSTSPSLPPNIQLPISLRQSVRVIDILALRETNGLMTAILELIQRWTDPSLSFDRISRGREHLDFVGSDAEAQLASIWTPRIEIDNQGSPTRNPSYAVSIFHDGRVVLIRRLEAEFRVPVDMASFPFDRQRLPLVFVTPRYSASEVDITTTDFDRQYSSIEQRLSATNWRPRSIGFRSDSFYGWNAQPISRQTMTLTVDRDWKGYILRLFVPFSALMSLSLFILWAPLSILAYGNRTAMVFSSLLALAALSYTFEANFPGSISLNSPIAFMISLGYFYLPFVLMLDLTLGKDGSSLARRYPYLLAEIRKNIRVSVPLVFMAVCLVSLFAFGRSGT